MMRKKTDKVIESLNENPGPKLTELSRNTEIKISALSKFVDRMLRDALLHLKQSSVDRRSIQLYISDYGKDALKRCLPDIDGFRATLAEILAHIRTWCCSEWRRWTGNPFQLQQHQQSIFID